jgi:hypothetical protein
MASGKMWTSMAFQVPSGCGIAVEPTYEFGLMSASVAFSSAMTLPSFANFILSVSPSRDLTIIVLPSI